MDFYLYRYRGTTIKKGRSSTFAEPLRDRQKFCVKVNKYFQSDETQEGEGN